MLPCMQVGSRETSVTTQVEIPNLESLDPSIRVGIDLVNHGKGKIVRTRDILKALNYLDTGYCGKVIKSY